MEGDFLFGFRDFRAHEVGPDDVILVVEADHVLSGRFEFVMEPFHRGERDDLLFGAELILLGRQSRRGYRTPPRCGG
jgi:hypothetical protein